MGQLNIISYVLGINLTRHKDKGFRIPQKNKLNSYKQPGEKNFVLGIKY